MQPRHADLVAKLKTNFPVLVPQLFLVLRTALLFVVFLVVDRAMKTAGDLPAESYAEPYLLAGLVERLGPVLLVSLLALTALLVRFGFLFDRWSALGLGSSLRTFIVALACLMAWPFTTLGYNYYFDQGYTIDRLVISALVPLIWFRPVFVYPFLLLAFAFLWQLGEPDLSSGEHFPFNLQILQVLNLFGAFFLLHALTGKRKTDGFLFLTCCLIASAYWVPGAAKLGMDWITFGHLYLMPLAAYAHGWLSFLEPSQVVALAQTVSWFDWPMRVLLLVVEVGSLCFLWRRSVSCALLVAVTIFHAGTFALYGYLFWTWTGLNLCVLALLMRDRRAHRIAVYSRTYFVMSLLLIATAGRWARPARLAWFDTRLTQTIRFDVVGVSGGTYSLPSRFFSPYGDVFTMANFGYVVADRPRLVFPYGTTSNRAVAERLMDATTPSQIFSLEAEIGSYRYNEQRAQRLYQFIERYFTHWNLAERSGFELEVLGPPAQFWSFPRAGAFRGEEDVRTVIVKEVTMLYDDERLTVIREIEIARIEISS